MLGINDVCASLSFKLLLPPRMYCVTLEDSVVEVKSSSKWLVRLKPVSGSNYQTLIGK